MTSPHVISPFVLPYEAFDCPLAASKATPVLPFLDMNRVVVSAGIRLPATSFFTTGINTYKAVIAIAWERQSIESVISVIAHCDRPGILEHARFAQCHRVHAFLRLPIEIKSTWLR